jgi:fimbrial chaperone protein
VRVYRWTQENGEDKLTPSRDLMISPPMLQIAAGDRQLIRVIRAAAPPGPVEGAYRVIIDELPVETQGQKGLQFVLRYSVPIFIGAAAGESAGAPQLNWSVRREGDRPVLEVANNGRTHAQLADLKFVDPAGRRTEVHPGLMGYVLPGAQMRWSLKSSAATFATGGTLESMINGTTTQQSLPALDRAR